MSWFHDDTPEARCLRRQDIKWLAQITADSTSPEILDLADKLEARWYLETEELLDTDILGYYLYEIREWKRDRKIGP